MRQIALDTETTGISTEAKHKIIEIGCVELIDRKFTGRHFHQYINPERDIDEQAFAIHGISLQSLEDKPIFSKIYPEFFEFIKGAELIIHNAPFDLGFIDYEIKLFNESWQSITDHCDVIDTLVLARQMHAGQRNNLDALCKRYKIDNSKREMHGALLDAKLLAQVYLAMTGGQGTLFDEKSFFESADPSNQFSDIKVARKTRNLRVIKASESELAEHEKKMAELAVEKW